MFPDINVDAGLVELLATLIASGLLSSEYVVRRMRRAMREEVVRMVEPSALKEQYRPREEAASHAK